MLFIDITNGAIVMKVKTHRGTTLDFEEVDTVILSSFDLRAVTLDLKGSAYI